MTPEDFLNKMGDLYATWAKDSNATSDPTERLEICEQFITDFVEALTLAGGHPEPPYPRVR